MIDIILFQVTTTQVRIKPKSAHGMLWLQTHFVNEDWDSIALGQADLENKHADQLSQDASLAGLRVYYPPPYTFKRK